MNAPRQDESGDTHVPQGALHRAGDAQLFVVDRGRGMPIVLVHGFPLDHAMWDAQLEPLAERWRVLAIDLRGFGNSTVTPGTVTMEQMADDVAALLDTLDLREPVVLAGLSMGGYVAFQFWARHAARLRALVLCDTRAVADTPEGAEGRHKLAQRVLSEGTAVAAEAMLPKLFGPETQAHNPQAIEAARQTILRNSPEGVAAALGGMAVRPNVTDQLSRIQLPTLVLVGRDDAISTVDEMRGMAKAIANSEFVVIPRSGHMTPMEAPAAFNEALEQFLTRVERGAPRTG